MAPKAKPKGKKKESEEQRRARQELEALAAAEAEAERRAAARRELGERAAREAALSAANSRALDAAWLQRMRAAKLEELQAEARVLSREHDAAVDRHDRLIEALLEEVAGADVQHGAAAAQHAEVLDQLLGLHGQRMAALRAQFEGDLAAVAQEFECEKAEAAALHHRAKRELGEVMAALKRSYADARAEAAAGYRLMEEEVRSRAAEGLNVSKLGLQGRIRELEVEVEAEGRAFEEGTGERQAAYRDLAAADAAAAEAIAQRTARLAQLQETLVQWRGRIVANSREWQRRNGALAAEKEAVLAHHTALKAQLARSRAAQEARLRQMSVAFAGVEAGLREQLATAQRILRLAHLGSKLMLPGEAAAAAAAAQAQPEGAELEAAAAAAAEGAELRQASPAGKAAATGATAASAGGSNSGDPALRELGLAPGSAGQRLLEAFMARMGGTAADRAALEQERLRLGAENAALRAVVAAVREGGSVGPGAVDGPLNTLLVVNGRLQQALGGAAAARRSAAGASPAPW